MALADTYLSSVSAARWAGSLAEALRRPWLARAAAMLLCAVLATVPMMLGGQPPWVICGLTFCTGACVLGAWFAAPVPTSRERWTWFALLLLSAVVWTLAQALPVPMGVVERVAPQSAEAVMRNAELLEQTNPTWAALSRDPGATWSEALKWSAYLAAFVASWLLSLMGYRRWILTAAAITTVAMAAIGFAHAIVGAQSLFGLYEPVQGGDSRLLAPLLNNNNLAGFLAFGTVLCLGLAIEEGRPGPRWCWLTAATATALGAAFTLSRGGLAALLGGVTLLLLDRARSRQGEGAAWSWKQAVLMSGPAALVVWGIHLMWEPIVAEWQQSDASKVDLLRNGAAFAFDVPWVGVGRGAFSSSFVAVHGSAHRFVHAENFIVQWVVEWGWPVGLALCIGLFVLVSANLRRKQGWGARGAVFALVTLAIANLFDFSLELAGVGVVGAAVLAAAAVPRRRRRGQAPDRLLYILAPIIGFAAVGFSVLLAPTVMASDPARLEHRLQRALKAGRAQHFRDTLKSALRYHPSEPAFTLLAATEATQRGDRRALSWYSRTMALAPGWTAPHLGAALALQQAGQPDQALLEMRQAAQVVPNEAGVEFVKRYGRDAPFEVVLRAAPRDRARWLFLQEVADQMRSTSSAQRLDVYLLKEDASLEAPRARRARRYLREHRYSEAIKDARTLVQGHPGKAAGYVVWAKALIAEGNVQEALAVYERGRTRTNGSFGLLEALAETQAELGRATQMRETVAQMVGVDARHTAASYRLLGRLERRLGNKSRAFRAYLDAVRILPEPQGLTLLAEMAEELGYQHRARETYQRLCDEFASQIACDHVDPQGSR